MAYVLLAFGTAFAALCVWLTVRIVNRRELWVKWALAGVVGVPMLYVLSFGPACWLQSRCQRLSTSADSKLFAALYWPIGLAAYHGIPGARVCLHYGEMWMPSCYFIEVPGIPEHRKPWFIGM
jgi:hypothetical protein